MQSVLATAVATPERSSGGLRVAGALIVPLGLFVMTLGTIWDIQWHVVIGRDSFWIPPHVVLYAGLALTIVTVAAVVFWETLAPAAHGISLCGVRASAGIWISAAGIATMLLAAPFDNWWHNTFGLDTTLWSPPHMMGLAGGAMIPCGAVAVLGRELRRGLMVSMRFGGASSADRALAVLPLVALGAVVSSAAGNWLGRLIAANKR